MGNAIKAATKYVAKKPDANGIIQYSADENTIWAELIARQQHAITGKACDEYLHGLALLDLPRHRIPQLQEVSCILMQCTGWQLAQVPALIDFPTFWRLLANRQFPCATFIRTREDMDYLQEPDIFHEIFGHCPMLTNPHFAQFTQNFGRLGCQSSHEEQVFLARLYWFTIEFGLIDTPSGQRIYGGGILSSIGETEYCFSQQPQRQSFDCLQALRTPYRIDIMQPIYYVINDLKQLFDLTHRDLMNDIHEAKRLGLFSPAYPPKQKAG